jgi:hypothetical protein
MSHRPSQKNTPGEVCVLLVSHAGGSARAVDPKEVPV